MGHVPRHQTQDQAADIELRDIWNLLLRNRWLIAGFVAFATLLFGLYAFLATPTYRTAAVLRIDPPQSLTPSVDFMMPFGRAGEVATEMEVLRSRTIAEEVVSTLGVQLNLRRPRRASVYEVFQRIEVSRDAPDAQYSAELREDGRFLIQNHTLGVDVGVFGPGQPIKLDGATLTLAESATNYGTLRFDILSFAEAVLQLRESVDVGRPNREATIITVQYRSPDTLRVHLVPNALAETFIRRRQEVQTHEATSTVLFLEEQIAALSGQLEVAENLLQEFRESENVVSLPAEAAAHVNRLAQLQAQRDQVDSERQALLQLLEEIQTEPAREPGAESPYRRLVAFPTIFRNQATTELLRSLTAVENERAHLLNRRTLEHPDVQVLTARIHQLEEQLRSITTTYLAGLSNQVESLDSALRGFRAELESVPAKEVQFARLQRQATVLNEIYTILQTRLKEAEIAQAVQDASIRIVDPAVLPTKPFKPRKRIVVALGLLLGLVGGVIAAFIREHMDTKVHTKESLQNLAGAPVLGVIPRIQPQVTTKFGSVAGSERGRAKRGAAGVGATLIAGYDSRSPVSEAYRSLRTNITFSNIERPPRTLVITSATPGDGKSTTSSNLAITLVQQGSRVLLIDTDMRRGRLHSVFDQQREPGLSNVLLGTSSWSETVHQLDFGQDGTLSFMATGPLPPNPAELLGSQRMRQLLEELEQEYEFVVLDAPPLALVTDAALLGTNADGVIVVARASITDRDALAYALEQLRHVRAPILGTVLNDIDVGGNGRYYGHSVYHSYYYGVDDD